MKMHLETRHAVLKCIRYSKLCTCVIVHKYLKTMPALNQYDHLPNDGFLASSTDAFSDCLHTKSVEVRLQASQHVVQLVRGFGGTCRGNLSLGLDLMETEEQSGNNRLREDHDKLKLVTFS